MKASKSKWNFFQELLQEQVFQEDFFGMMDFITFFSVNEILIWLYFLFTLDLDLRMLMDESQESKSEILSLFITQIKNI
jgi:hypothetical protein